MATERNSVFLSMNLRTAVDRNMRPTAHTTLPVPCILVDDTRKDVKLREGGRLCDLAPTLLELLGLPIPAEMTGKSLLA